jgi:transcriptional activator of cad operon
MSLRIGAWCVNPASGQISREGEIIRVEARTMRLLLCLAEHAGEVVSIDELLDQAWAGVIVTPDSVYQAVASLRRLLGDDAKEPTYIATVPRLGYRMVAAVSPLVDQPIAPPALSGAATPNVGVIDKPTHGKHWRAGAVLAGAVILCCVLVAAFLFYGNASNNHHATATAGVPQKAVAVLPFLDLTTQEMNEEYFADGMTEELIGDLSKIPAFRVPAPASSFYFKGKQLPVAQIAQQLGVTYLVDGSVRKSGNVYRVAARLVRADNGYVMWTESYDRPLNNLVEVQKDIAVDVSRAVRASIDGATNSAPAARAGGQ